MNRRKLSWPQSGLALLFAIVSIGCGSTPKYEKTYELTLSTRPEAMAVFEAAEVRAIPVYVLLCDSQFPLPEEITKDRGKFQEWFQKDDDLRRDLKTYERMQLVVYKPGTPPEDPIELKGELLQEDVKLWVLANFPSEKSFKTHSAFFKIVKGTDLDELFVEIANNEVKFVVQAED